MADDSCISIIMWDIALPFLALEEYFPVSNSPENLTRFLRIEPALRTLSFDIIAWYNMPMGSR